MPADMIPELSSPLNIQPEVTSAPPMDADDNLESKTDFMYVPYVVLGGVLILLAVASFIHYHVQNRGKYEEQKYKAKAGMENSNKKYRVTLNINGMPYTVGKPVQETMDYGLDGEEAYLESQRYLHALPPLGKVPASLPPINEKDLMKQRKYMRHEDSSDALSSKGRGPPHNTGHSSPEAQCSYVNEAFDSSGDSERSLISRQMLKKQKKAEKHRESSSHMETLSSDLELEDDVKDSTEIYKDKSRRKAGKNKHSSGNHKKSSSSVVMPAIPDRGTSRKTSETLGDSGSKSRSNRNRIHSESGDRPPKELESSGDSLGLSV